MEFHITEVEVQAKEKGKHKPKAAESPVQAKENGEQKPKAAETPVQDFPYILDNCILMSKDPGIRFRRSKKYDDRDPNNDVAWGTTLYGNIEENTWFKDAKSGLFLPTHVHDKQILFPMTNELASDEIEPENIA